MKKLIYLLGAMALMAGFTACGGDGDDNKKPINLVLDGFYIYGDAVGTQEFLSQNQMAAGSNEVDKTVRQGMYEKYIWLEAGKDLRLVENSAGNKVYYGATLEEVNYGYDENDPDCKNYENNPNMKILFGQMVIGEEAPAMQVAESGMYHIVLDNNYVGDLDYPQIIIQRAKWGVRGGMNSWGFTEAEETVNADGSITYTLEDQNLAKNGEYKWASCHAWKINLDADGTVKAEVGLGLTDGKLSNTGGNIAVTDAGLYTLTLTWKPTAGAVADAFTHDFTLTEASTMPDTMYIIGNDFGNWDWTSDGVVEMVPVYGKPGKFWAALYMTTTTEFKFCAVREWNGDFTGLVNNSGYTTPENNMVEADNLYLIVVDLNTDTVSVAPTTVYGMGDCFGGWNELTYPFTLNNDGTVQITTTAAGALRMYVDVEGAGNWWNSEFNIYDGVIVYRGTGNDQAAVNAAAGQTVTLNFNAGTGSIQ